MARRINWKAFRRGFYDGFSGAPLWRAIVKIWNRRTLMTDIVERLLAPAYWMSGSSEGHEGDNSAPIEAAKTIESLRSELAKVNMEVDRLTRTNEAKREHRDKLLEATAKQAAEIEKLRAALRNALERGVFTQYWGDDDECGTHSCCGIESYKPHDAECWTVKARAALGGSDE